MSSAVYRIALQDFDTSWYAPSLSVTRTTTDRPRLILPVLTLSSTFSVWAGYLKLLWQDTTHKINRSILYHAGPAIEPKHFVRELDTFFCSQIMHLLSSRTWSRWYVFRTQLLFQSILKCRNLLCCILTDMGLSFFEWVLSRRCEFVLVARSK